MRSLINHILYDWDAPAKRRGIIAAGTVITCLAAALVLCLTTDLGWWTSVLTTSIIAGLVLSVKLVGYQRLVEVARSARLGRRKMAPEVTPMEDLSDSDDPRPIAPLHPGLPPDYDEEFHFLYVLEVAVPAMTLSALSVVALIRLPLPPFGWLLLVECLLVLVGPFLTFRRIVLRKWRPVLYAVKSNILVRHQRGSYWLLSISSPEDTSPMESYDIETAKKGLIEQLFGLDSVTIYLNPVGTGKQKKIRRVRNIKGLLAVQDGAARYKTYLQEKQVYTMELVAWQQRNPGVS